jgi:hypothetical protein
MTQTINAGFHAKHRCRLGSDCALRAAACKQMLGLGTFPLGTVRLAHPNLFPLS